MTLPAFATVEDLEARQPAGSGALDEDRAQAALDDASALMRAEASNDYVTDDTLDGDVPDVFKTICCRAALRALANPQQVEQESTGPFSVSHGEVYLTSAERRLISQAAGSTSGVWTLGTTRNDVYGGDLLELDGTVYLPVVGSEPIPYLPASDPFVS